MVDLTVIDGDGDPQHWESKISQQHFEVFVVTLLRSLASGDNYYQVAEAFFRYVKHAQERDLRIGPVIAATMQTLNNRAFNKDAEEGFGAEQADVIHAALRALAEILATDTAAKARLSKRRDNLTAAIERKIIASETRSRENGWSYTQNLTSRLGNPQHRGKR